MDVEGFHMQGLAMFLHSMGVAIVFGSPGRWRKEIVEKGAPRLKKMWNWGDLPAVFLNDTAPDEDDLYGPRGPGWVAHVWLRSKGMAADANRSDLIVSFFPEEISAPIDEIVERGVRNLDWECHAKDFRHEKIYPWFFGLDEAEAEKNAD